MPPRRLFRENSRFMIIIAIVFIPWLVEAQQQQRQAVQQRYSEVVEVNPFKSAGDVRLAHHVETPFNHGRRKNTLVPYKHRNHVSAIATLAPARSAVAAPSLRLRPSVNAELSTPQIARSLGDWEVEDFVLLATVDGKLYAYDRKTGNERWYISYEQPMVQTKYHPRNNTDTIRNYAPTAIDDYLWIVEPSRDGSLYIYRPNGPSPGLVDTGLTMKKLVEEMAPYGDEDPPVMYTGEKKTNLLTVDANTGKVLSWFGSMNSLTTKEMCTIDQEEDNEGTKKCPKTATLTLGRTEYTVGIFGRRDGHHIATLTFSEWGPNNYDQDLQQQYMQYASTLDNKYIYTRHDGGVIGFYHGQSAGTDDSGLLFHQKLSSPVVRIFDVARPWGSDKNTPDLVILPQPQPKFNEEKESALIRAGSVFLNHTEDGSWYAMSGKSYPFIIGGIQKAQCSQEEWLQRRSQWNILNHTELSEALVGLHSIENHNKLEEVEELLTISAPKDEGNAPNSTHDNFLPALSEDAHFLVKFRQLSHLAAYSLIELLQNPILLFLIFVFVVSNQGSIAVTIRDSYNSTGSMFLNALVKILNATPIPSVRTLINISENGGAQMPLKDFSAHISANLGGPTIANPQCVDLQPDSAILDRSREDGPSPILESPKKKEKKAHRGRRGGVKHKKGARNNAQDGSVAPKPKLKDPQSADEVIEDVQQTLPPPKAELESENASSSPHETSGPIIRIGALEVNTEKLIGTGSNGTMVFEGKFDGREVAVKRMLIQFFDIAFQETRLLRESDDHPNVVRYFAQQQAAGFLYIALELCPASLADVIEKPLKNRELAQAGERNLPNVLYQIANGIRHLHKLRIVHRDLKPQNILVSIGKDGGLRLLVSDFGLCKKLEGEQSSFRATTAHAAGTSGWRAPELLFEDEKNSPNTVIDPSTDSNSESIVLDSGLLPSHRATRAIDIFSLGLVFFYVLTKGSHPFDCGDRFMREVNIRQGKSDLEALEVLGDFTFEAKNLIGNMLAADPKSRPYAYQVLAHPFFWSAKKRLNFLCDVSDHFEKECRDPPTPALQELERYAPKICGNDFLKLLGNDFVESMGKQRRYTGTRLLDLLRALRNKRNHYEDMSEKLKREVGPLPDGYLSYWSRRFPQLLVICWTIVYDLKWDETDRFKDYY